MFATYDTLWYFKEKGGAALERTVEEYIELYKRLTPVIFKKLYFYQNISLGPYQIDLENLIFEGYDAIHNLIGTNANNNISSTTIMIGIIGM